MEYKVRSRVTEKEFNALMRYAAISDNAIVELGVLNGGTTEGFANHAKKGVMVLGIDLFQRTNLMDPSILYKDYLSQYQNTFLMVGDCIEIGKYLDIAIGLLFIDADHKYLSVKRMASLWIPKVAENGIIAFHDAMPCSAVETLDGYRKDVAWLLSIKSVVDEIIESNLFEVVEIVDSIIFLRQKCITTTIQE